jgi:hypothetical protein
LIARSWEFILDGEKYTIFEKMKQLLFNISAVFRICIAFCALALLGCPYIDHGTSDAPELVTAEDIQGCYYSETFSKDTYIDRSMPSIEDPWKKGREKHIDKIVCKKMCFEGDSAHVNVRAFALSYDTTNQYVEDTIRYKLSGATVTYDTTDSGITVVTTPWSSEETVYNEVFPVYFKKPDVDGIIRINVESSFPTEIYLEKPGYYTGLFKMAVHFDQYGMFSQDHDYKKITVDVSDSVEVFSTKGWDVCNGF